MQGFSILQNSLINTIEFKILLLIGSDEPPGVTQIAVATTFSEWKENQTLVPDDYFQLPDDSQKEHSVKPSYYTSEITLPHFFNNQTIKVMKDSKSDFPTADLSIAIQGLRLQNQAFNESSVIVTSTAQSSLTYLKDDFDFNHLNIIRGGNVQP